jgi:hypothetical protein
MLPIPTISCRRLYISKGFEGRGQSPRFDLSTLRLRRMYRALASGTKSVVTGASLSGATRSSQRRAGISHKSISAGIGSSVWGSRCATAIVLACENVASGAIRVITVMHIFEVCEMKRDRSLQILQLRVGLMVTAKERLGIDLFRAHIAGFHF